MKKKDVFALMIVAGALSLSACGTSQTSTSSDTPPGMSSPMISAMPSMESSPDLGTAPTMGAGVYLDYEAYQAKKDDFVNDKVVYFFAATWCHECQDTDKALMSADGVPAGLTVVKIDYDSATDLRKMYGVTHQHTFVQVDSSGQEITKWSGTKTGADIKAKTK